MGKDEVLGFLQQLRDGGDEGYYTYTEVHSMMCREGVHNHYTSVWRSINVLWSDGLLEAVFEGDILQRTARFRVKGSHHLRGSGVKRVHNTYQGVVESRGRASHREPPLVAARR